MSSATRADITVVVVLYGTTPAASIALTSLAESLGEHAGRFAVEVHDNSPHPGPSPHLPGLDLAVHAQHPENPGLVVPYALALSGAERRRSAWLLLLDQDTRITRRYIDEVVSAADAVRMNKHVGVMAPLLFAGNLALSPHKPLRMRPRLLGGPGVYPASSAYAYLNSGAVLRVSALRKVGGFPPEFPLDFLDHAVSARLKAAGYSLLVLDSRLEHQLSVLDMSSVPPQRLRAIFRAEEDYFFAQKGRSEGLWLLARRAARGALLALHVHGSTHRNAELEAVYVAFTKLTRNTRTAGHSRGEDDGNVL